MTLNPNCRMKEKKKIDEIRKCINPLTGRFAVANKDLEPGELFLEETPFAVGPKSCSPLICLGCNCTTDGSIVCPECKWPVCSLSCSTNPQHANAECKVFSSANIIFQKQDDPSIPSPQLECITPLRVLLAKENNLERWEEEVAVMESHMKERKVKRDWEIDQINIVAFLRNKCDLKDRFSEELIHFVCGILEVNGFEIRTHNGNCMRGLYPKLATLSHNCVVNTTHTIVPSKNYKAFGRTTIKVQNGEELFCSYTHSLSPTLTRRENLQTTKYFDCNCQRCSDPTELGSHTSSLKCTKCDNGLILSVAPLDAEAQWNCTHCEFHLSADQVRRVYKMIETDIEQIQSLPTADCTLEMAEKTLRRYKSVLHPYHAFNTTIRHCLIQLYGRASGYTFEDLPDILLERKIQLCQEVLHVINIIEPGYTRIRGLTLYELHVPIMLFTRSRYDYGEIDKATFCSKMEEVVKILEEAVQILLVEDPSTPEGVIGEIGQTSLEQLKSSLDVLQD